MIEFPVSSGNAHRVKEVDVDPMKDLIGDSAIKAIEDKSEPAKKEESEEPESKTPEPTEAEKFNTTNPLGVIMFGGMPEPPKALEPPKPVTPVVGTIFIRGIRTIAKFRLLTKIDFNVMHLIDLCKNCKFVAQATS